MKNWETYGAFGLAWVGPKEQRMPDETWATNIMNWKDITFNDLKNYQRDISCLYPLERHQWVKFFSEWPNFPFDVSRETNSTTYGGALYFN